MVVDFQLIVINPSPQGLYTHYKDSYWRWYDHPQWWLTSSLRRPLFSTWVRGGLKKPTSWTFLRSWISRNISPWNVCPNIWYIPIGSMYGIFTYIYHEFMVNVGKYTIHGSYGIYIYTIVIYRLNHFKNHRYLLYIGGCYGNSLLNVQKHLGKTQTNVTHYFWTYGWIPPGTTKTLVGNSQDAATWKSHFNGVSWFP